MLLDKYMQSNEYFKEIETAVDAKREFKAVENEYLEVIKGMNLDKKIYDELDGAAVNMMVAARELAYKKGIQDGITLVTSCVSAGSGKTDSDFNKAWQHIEVKEAWDRKAELYNKLVDLMVDKGMDGFAAADIVDKLCDSVEEFAKMVFRHGIDSSEFSGREAVRV